MAWSNVSKLFKQINDTMTGLVVARHSSASTGNLQEWRDDVGNILLFIRSDGELFLGTSGGAVEIGVLNGNSSTVFRVYNSGAGGFHFTSTFATFEVPSIHVKEGTNRTMGTAVLSAGTVTVNTTAVTASSRIFLTAQNTGGTAGELSVSARTAGTSFTITSASGSDTRTVAWLLVEPTSTL